VLWSASQARAHQQQAAALEQEVQRLEAESQDAAAEAKQLMASRRSHQDAYAGERDGLMLQWRMPIQDPCL
jgi:hypothetical protein